MTSNDKFDHFVRNVLYGYYRPEAMVPFRPGAVIFDVDPARLDFTKDCDAELFRHEIAYPNGDRKTMYLTRTGYTFDQGETLIFYVDTQIEDGDRTVFGQALVEARNGHETYKFRQTAARFVVAEQAKLLFELQKKFEVCGIAHASEEFRAFALSAAVPN